MKEWQSQMGDAFKPSALLEKLVAEGKKFSDLPPQPLNTKPAK
jgi:3-hydroxyacyl-CoA dehydrogenase